MWNILRILKSIVLATGFLVLAVVFLCTALTERVSAAGIDYASPAAAGIFSGITTTINGTGFTGVTDVAFGTVTLSRSDWTFISDTQIRAIVPPSVNQQTGNVDLFVIKGSTRLVQLAGFVYTRKDPVISDIQPRSTGIVGGSIITISGSALSNAQSVIFNGVAADSASVTVIDDNTLKVKVPPSAGYTAGPVNLTVKTNYGLSSRGDLLTYYQENPDFTGVSPATAGINGGSTVTITGARLSEVVGVKFGTVMADATTIQKIAGSTPEQFTVKVPSSGSLTATTVDVTIYTTTGFATLPNAFQYTLSNPTISSVSPSSTPAFGGGTATINGSGLGKTLDVKFGSVSVDPASINVINDGQISVTIPQSPGNAAGKVGLTVITQTGQATLAAGFEYTRQDPVIQDISPRTGGSYGGYPITLKGISLKDVTSVSIGVWNLSGSALSLQADGSLVVSLPSVGISVDPSTGNSYPAQFNSVDVTVRSATGFNTKTGGLTFAARVDPVITSLTPNKGSELGGTDVVVSGSNFDNLLGVKFAGAWGKVTSSTSTEIKVKTTSRSPGVVGMTVQTQYGSTTLQNSYTYIAMPPVPVTYSFVTTGATAASTAGTTDIQITGTYLSNATVTIGGVPATVKSTSYSSLTCTAPVNTAGVKTIVVTNSSASVSPSLKPTITYVNQAPATVTTASPATGTLLGGTTVTISGTNLQGSKVTFDGVSATVTDNPADGLTVTAKSPAHALGQVDIAVTTAAGTVKLVKGYTYVNPPAPTITAVTPSDPWTTGGNTVKLEGTNLQGATVTIDGNSTLYPVTTVQVIDTANMTFVVPAHPAGSATLRVTTPGGYAEWTLTYKLPPFTITGITPSTANSFTGTPVTITGTNLSGVMVLFREAQAGVTTADLQATSVVVAADGNSLTAFAPPRATPGPVSVLVNKNSTTVALANSFTYVTPAPIISAVSPTEGTAAGGTAMTITGSNLANASVKFVDPTASTSVSVTPTLNANGSLSVTTPAGTAGNTVDVMVTTPGGNVTRTGAFKYLTPPPVVWSKDVLSGTVDGGTTVTIIGQYLTGATAIKFGSNTSSVVSITDGTIKVTTPAGVPGDVDVSVTTPGGTTTLVEKYTYVAPAPVLSTVSPASANNDSGSSITLSGTYLWGSRVYFGSLEATPVTVAADGKSLTAKLPYRVPGKVDVTVTTSAGSKVMTDGFLYLPPVPTLASLDPTMGPLGGTTIKLTGTGFTANSSVKFGSTPATPLTVANDGLSLTVNTPVAAAAGTAQVTVTTDGGTTPIARTYTYVAKPTVTALSASTGPSAGGTSVTVTGTDFVGTVSVTVGGAAATGVAVNSPTQLTIVTPAGTAGDAPVIVTAAGGSSDGSLKFRYLNTPVISGLSPVEGAEAGNELVHISGTSLGAVTSVKFGTASATIKPGTVSETGLDVVSPAGTGTVAVTAANSANTSNAVNFTYRPVPTLSRVEPAYLPLTGGKLTLTGSGFTIGTRVTIGGQTVSPDPIASDGSTVLTVTAPPLAAGSASISVTTAGGTSIAAQSVTYVAAPVVTSLSVQNGPAAGGTSVGVTGRDFVGTVSVTVGGAAATGVTVQSPTQLTFVTPQGASGAAAVVVTAAGGSSDGSVKFTYLNAPAISALSATEGAEAGGETIHVTGTNLGNVTSVQFGTAAAAIKAGSITATGLDVIVPGGTGSVQVTASNSAGTSNGMTYIYRGVPVLTGIDPAIGPLGGRLVTVTGSGFTPATTVSFGGTTRIPGSISGNGDSLTVTAPTSTTAGPVQVTVTTAGGTSSPAQTFTYVAAPAVTSLSVQNGPAVGGTSVSVTGSDFVGTVSVTVGSTAATGVTVQSPTQLTFVTPRGTAGDASVVVTAAGGSSDGSVKFTYLSSPVLTGLDTVEGPEVGGSVVTIRGSGLSSVSSVSFGTQSAAISARDAQGTSLTVTAPAGTGSVPVTVSNVAGASNAVTYTYRPVPALTRIDPATIPLAGGKLTLTGTGFTTATGVTIDGQPVTPDPIARDDSTVLTVTAPQRSQAGTVSVFVTTTGGTSQSLDVDYVDHPELTAISPDSGPLAGGGTVTLTGSGFDLATTVTFGNNAAQIDRVENQGKTLKVVVPVGAAAGTVNVTASSAGGSSQALGYTYIDAPAVTSVDPSSGPLSGGTLLTLRGSGLSADTRVSFGTATLTPDSIAPAGTSLSFRTPASTAAGTIAISVFNAGGASAGSVGFDYLPEPVITGLSVTEGPASGGTAVVIEGSGLTGATSVTFGGRAASGWSVTDGGTKLHVTSPQGDAGTVAQISVTTPGGSAVSPVGFAYRAEPVISGFTPNSGPVSGNQEVTITGDHLDTVQSVTIGGAPAAIVAGSVTPQAFKVLTPAHASGPVAITLTLSGGVQLTASGSYTYRSAPAILSLEPPSGPIGGGFDLKIRGSDLLEADGSAATVNVGGTPLAVTASAGDGSWLTVRMPAHAAGPVSVTATTGYGSATASPDFIYDADLHLTALTPDNGPLAGGNRVVLTGGSFDAAMQVSFGGKPATITEFRSAGEVVVTVPAGTSPGSVTVSVTGKAGSAALTGAYSYTDTLAMDPPAGELKAGEAGKAYAETLRARNGVAPFTFTVTGGALPEGLELDSATGKISGTIAPTVVGRIGFTVMVTDGAGMKASGSYVIAVGQDRFVLPPLVVSLDPGEVPDGIDLTGGEASETFVEGAIISVSPTNAGTAKLVGPAGKGAAAQMKQSRNATPPNGYHLYFTPAQGFVGRVEVHYELVTASGRVGAGLVTFVISVSPEAVAADASEAAQGFVDRRQGLLADALDTPGLLERRESAALRMQPPQLSPSASGLRMTFDVTRPLDMTGGSPVTLWTRGSASLYQRSGTDATGKASDWGTFALFSGGADYRISDTLLAGITLDYHRMSDPTDADTLVSGSGWLAGPYGSVRLMEHLYLDGSMLYGQTSNTLSSTLSEGQFSSKMLLGRAGLRGEFDLKGGTIATPSLKLDFVRETVENFHVQAADGSSVAVNGFARQQLRGSIGIDFSRNLNFGGDLAVVPKVGISAGFAGLDGTGTFGSVSAGLDVSTRNGWNLSSSVRVQAASGTRSIGVQAALLRHF